MDKNRLVQRLYASRKDPELYKELTTNELADLVILVLNTVKSIDSAIETKKVDVEKKYDDQAKKVLTNAEQQSRNLLTEVRNEVSRLVRESNTALNETKGQLEARVQQALENIRDGQDGIVTEEEIRRAAEVAVSLIELPNFEELVGVEITRAGEAIRNALELLPEDERYSVQIQDVEGLSDTLNRLSQIRSSQGGTIGKNQVYSFIRQAIADGTISTGGATNLADLEDVVDTAPSANQVLTWNDTESRWEPADPPGASGGEANTASNLGAGSGVFGAKVGVDLRFKSLVGGTGVTLSSDASEITIDADQQTVDVVSNVATDRILGRVTAGSGDSEELTAAQVRTLINVENNANNYTHPNHTGDVTSSGDGATTIANNAVTFAKMQDIATDHFIGRHTAGSGDPEQVSTAQARAILNVEDGADVTDTVNVTAAGALMDSEVTNLAAVKAFDPADYAAASHTHTKADLTDIADFLLESEVDADIKTLSLPANTTISAFGATLVDDADAATARTTLGVDAAGTDNSTDVTLAGTPDYITISGQTITRNQIDLTADVTGVLPEVNLPNASTTAEGVVELATTAEVDTGTDTGRTVTPDALAGSYAGTKSVQMVVFEWATDVATGDGKYYFRVPPALNGMDIVNVHAEVITAGTTGTTDIQLHNVTDAVDICSTKITIDSGETGSDTAATAAVINTANDSLATNDIIRVDVDAVSSGTAPQGLIVSFEARLP